MQDLPFLPREVIEKTAQAILILMGQAFPSWKSVTVLKIFSL